MASIAILCHELDRVLWPRRDGNGYNCPYLIGRMAMELTRRGHQVEIVHGLKAKNPNADLAILHVDLTCVPADYLDFAASFKRCLNSQVADIRKTTVSMAQLSRHPGWRGPVIVKSNLNCNGSAEVLKNKRLSMLGGTPAIPEVREFNDYLIYESFDLIPDAIRELPDIAIDAFMPEREDGLYAIRNWAFCGDQGQCWRLLGPDPIVKGSNAVRRERIPETEAMRQIRIALGFDYGRFDFVLNDGEHILIDANKTPASPYEHVIADGTYLSALCDGIESYL